LASIAETVETQDMNEKLYESLNRLPEKEKMVIRLHYIKGFKFKEIAKIMSAPESTIKTICERAKSRLFNYLKEEMPVEKSVAVTFTADPPAPMLRRAGVQSSPR